MATVLLLIHLLIAAAMIAVVLLQKSEGGALGIGGGGGAGGFLTGRGTANLLTRTTAMLAAAFFVTSMALTMLAQRSGGPGTSVFDTNAASPSAPADGAAPATSEPAKGGILDKLQQRGAPNVPQGR